MRDIVILNLRKLVLHPTYFCARVLGVCSSPVYKTMSVNDFVNRVLSDKPAEIQKNDF